MKLLMLFSIMLVMALVHFTHPMAMVGIISLQSLVICLAMSSTLQSPWFSFILFLVFMGGLMVLFTYISSLASNEEFEIIKLSSKSMKTWPALMFSVLMISVSLVMNKSPLKMYSLNTKEMIFKIYSMEMSSIIMMTMTYLLLVLIIIVSIITLKEGPLRITR